MFDVYMNEMKNIEEQNKRFFNKIAKYYDSIFGKWIKNMQMRAIKSANLKDKTKMLDAGCGTGNLLQLLEKEKRFNLYGIDVSEEMLKIAKKRVREAKLQVASVEKIPFKSNFFDYIWSVDAFHHYANKEKAMEEFSQVLKKNGKLIIIDLNFGKHLNKFFRKLEPGNNGIYTRKEMKSFFAKYHFRDIKQEKVGLFTMMTTGIK